jgi:hypothetical protein
VKWTGYDVSNNTWEPEDHIMDPALINAFKLKFESAYHAAVAEIAKRKGFKQKRARQPLSKNYPLQVQMCTPGGDGQSSTHERAEIERIRKFFLRFRVSGALRSTIFGTRPHKGAREHKGAPKKI